MIVVGADPGLRNCALTAFEYDAASAGRYEIRGHVTAKTDTKDSIIVRLRRIWAGASSFIGEVEPDLLVVEEQAGAFAGNQREGKTNAKALYLRDVSGILMAAGWAAGASVGTVTPQQAKIAVLGRGSRSADKRQIIQMVEALTGRRMNEHEAD